MVDLQRLTEEHFTAETGIEVNYTVLPENDVRDKISQEFSSQAGTYDVASLSNFEIPIYADSGWIAPLDEYIEQDEDFDQDDILGPMAESLEGEDGQHLRRAVLRRVVVPDVPQGRPRGRGHRDAREPDLAGGRRHRRAGRRGATDGMAGICLRGLPGWGQVFAPLTTVVNTFGGTWFTEDWEAQVDAPEFRRPPQFYVDLVREHGQAGAAQSGFTECLNSLQQGNAAMWYDATSAAGSLEARRTRRSRARSATRRRRSSRPTPPAGSTPGPGPSRRRATKKDKAWEFMSWASSKEYEELVGTELSWSQVPAGKRCLHLREPRLPSPRPRPSRGRPRRRSSPPTRRTRASSPDRRMGIQFVGIPDFPDIGDAVLAARQHRHRRADDGEVGARPGPGAG